MVQTPKDISIKVARNADNGKAIKIIGILIQKEAFLSKGNSFSLDPNTFLLKNSTNPPG
mgnify:CR=1 FL=1